MVMARRAKARPRFAEILAATGSALRSGRCTMTNVFGPVLSRRLGRSFGINNVPFKTCSYACVYCQLGLTGGRTIERRARIAGADLVAEVRARLDALRREDRLPDHLTFVPDGEPTLDEGLGETIRAMREFGIPIAVLTNGSLVWDAAVRADLLEADWVSVKVDTVDERTWRDINRPHDALNLDRILGGIRDFAAAFRGTLTTETMLLRDVNVADDQIARLTDFLVTLDPAVAYVAIPTRPAAEPWARIPDEETVNRVVQLLAARLRRVEYLIGYEEDALEMTGDPMTDLVAMCSIRPLREDDARELLVRAGADWERTRAELITDGLLVAAPWEGTTWYLRRFAPV
jgi:wyosine [tRNA(Phe)-imidazoG37] synthetase (radical SAM superfamily)